MGTLVYLLSLFVYLQGAVILPFLYVHATRFTLLKSLLLCVLITVPHFVFINVEGFVLLKNLRSITVCVYTYTLKHKCDMVYINLHI